MQFAHIQNKELIGYNDLPQSVISAISANFKSQNKLSFSAAVLEDGFPLIIKPVTEYQHRDRHISLNTLATLPIINSRNALCTVESLIPIKYQQRHKCYTSPMAYNDLILITCPKQKLVLKADVLMKCHSREGTYLCPDAILKNSHDSSWLGINWTPGSQYNFPRSHIKTKCDDFQPLIHLGGRFFLSTMEQRVQLTSRTLSMTPLIIYSLPCNETSPLLPTGFGQCPPVITMSIPIFSRRIIRYIPWVVPANHSTLNLHYQSLKFGPRLHFNKTTIKALDETFNRINGPLNTKIKVIKDDINSIKETTVTTTTKIIAYAALTLAVVNIVMLIIIACIIRRTLRTQPSDTTCTNVRYTKGKVSLDLDCCKECSTPLKPTVDDDDANDDE